MGVMMTTNTERTKVLQNIPLRAVRAMRAVSCWVL
jgi:hypothetical protein